MTKFPGFFQRSLRRYRLGPRRVSSFEVAEQEPRLPTSCACCGATATLSRREQGRKGHHCVLVPYCDECARHASRATQLRYAALGGSLLLAVSSAGLLSLSWFPHWVVVVVSAAMPLLPWAWLWHFGLPRQLGHAARGQALWWQGDALFICSRSWATECARANGKALRESTGVAPRWGRAWVCGPVLATLLSLALHPLLCPSVRVMNFTEQRLSFSVDGRVLGNVEPTSGESPAAGVEFRVPSGARRLRVTSAGGRIDADESVTVYPGQRHLFAPGAREECFYVQRLAYGRSRLPGTGQALVEQRRPLVSPARFWVIGSEVDPWFVPEKSLGAGATTGGVVSLLRMGRCR